MTKDVREQSRLVEVYRTWNQNRADIDMKKALEREITLPSVVELLARLDTLKAENEELKFKAQRLIDVIENPHPTKHALQVGMASGQLGKYLNELKGT